MSFFFIWKIKEPPKKFYLSLEDQFAEQMFTQITERKLYWFIYIVVSIIEFPF